MFLWVAHLVKDLMSFVCKTKIYIPLVTRDLQIRSAVCKRRVHCYSGNITLARFRVIVILSWWYESENDHKKLASLFRK